MMTGMEGLDDAKIIANARMQDNHEHMQAIREAQATGDHKPNHIKRAMNGVLGFVKRIGTQSPEEKQGNDTPQMKLNNDQA